MYFGKNWLNSGSFKYGCVFVPMFEVPDDGTLCSKRYVGELRRLYLLTERYVGNINNQITVLAAQRFTVSCSYKVVNYATWEL